MTQIDELAGLRRLELGGGQVDVVGRRLILPPVSAGYGDAQVDDYGRFSSRARFVWQPGTRLDVRARFSHGAEALRGTAGFGFWNAPFGDPTTRYPALPQAVWFFFASAPTDLPLPRNGRLGRGWFAATLDAGRPGAPALTPLAPLLLLLNQIPALYRQLWPRLWPLLRPRLGISFALLPLDITQWHSYSLHWRANGCAFYVDGFLCLHTPCSPRGPLGFVCWLDNQYLAVQANGRVAWGTLPTTETQWLEIAALQVRSQSKNSLLPSAPVSGESITP